MLKELPLRVFLDTQSDPEDMQENGCTVLENFEMNNIGYLTIRHGKKVKSYLDEIKCEDLERCNTSLGKFFVGYDKSRKKFFRINKL